MFLWCVVCMSGIAKAQLCLIVVCSSSFLFEAPLEGCASWLWPFLVISYNFRVCIYKCMTAYQCMTALNVYRHIV